jgi:iron-sulfur cluster repair protein YtfE (RIC family)
MLTRIGATRAPDDVVDLLLECHARIRSFTALAARLAGEAPAADEVRIAAAQVRRYFEEALPLHALDEEESILPRLAGRDAELDRALATMHDEHAAHGETIERVVRLCRELEAAPERHAELSPPLAAAADALRAHFVRHLEPEEETIFPAIRRLLGPEERAEIVRELRARRDPRAG